MEKPKDSKIILDIINEQSLVDVSKGMLCLVESTIEMSLKILKLDFDISLTIILIDNDGIKTINKEHRGINLETDVLSFPLLEFENTLLTEKASLSDLDKDPETDSYMLGDILVSLEKAREQAFEFGHSFERELGFLIVHGLLHLMGFDHTNDVDRINMREKEELILSKLGLNIKNMEQ